MKTIRKPASKTAEIRASAFTFYKRRPAENRHCSRPVPENSGIDIIEEGART